MSAYSVRLFYSYSHADEGYKKEMEKYLSLFRHEGLLVEWSDRKIIAGQELDEKIKEQLDVADIIVFLVSIDFINSDACRFEWEYANRLAVSSKKTLISVIVRECPWLDFSTMKKRLALPLDGKPISAWGSSDEAWCSVYEGIKKAVSEIRKSFLLKDDFRKSLSLLEFCSGSDKEVYIDDLFVFPNIVRYSEKAGDSIAIVNSADEILRHNRVMVHGVMQSGKSVLLGHVFLEVVKSEFQAIFVDLHSISAKKPSVDVLKRLYYEQYSGDFDLWLERKNKIIIFDGLSRKGNSVDHVKFFEGYFEKSIVSVSSEEYDVFFSDDIRLSRYAVFEIKPFTHVKQEKLIKK